MATGRYVHRFDIDHHHSVHIYQGSLVEVQADALVSSDDNYLSASGGVSAALAQAAGTDVLGERLKMAGEKQLRLGEVVRTSGGGLPCRYLYHAITIEAFKVRVDEAALRLLVDNLLKCATEDGVRTLGMPALGTGAAGFDIARASEIIIEELLGRLVDTPIRHVVLALIADEAQRVFYEQLVRANAPRCAASSLRRIDQQLAAEPPGPQEGRRAWMARPSATPGGYLLRPQTAAGGMLRTVAGILRRITAFCNRAARLARSKRAVWGKPGGPAKEQASTPPRQLERSPGPAKLAEETGEQFPSLIDATRLAATRADRPRLVSGLATLLLKHADSADIEQELLRRPECHGFRGPIKQQLMEFLYLSEKNLRTALGPALFKAKDLRRMAEELGEECEPARDPEQLIDLILRALCFNLLAPPEGLTRYVARVERLILDLEVPDVTEANRLATGVEAAKLLEQVLKDLLRLYGIYLFGPGFEQELVQRQIVPPRRDGGVSRLTLGQVRDALVHLETLVKKDTTLRPRLTQLGQGKPSFLPARLTVEYTGKTVNCSQALLDFIRWRNREIVHDNPAAAPVPDWRAVREQLEHLRSFLLACRTDGVYPEVLRYEGLFENRNGERFVYFLDERNTQRRVRTDEKLDPRCHYYCFATNNPVYLFPVLIPKL